MSNLMGDSQKLSTKWNIPFQSHIPSLQSWLAIFVFNLFPDFADTSYGNISVKQICFEIIYLRMKTSSIKRSHNREILSYYLSVIDFDQFVTRGYARNMLI